MTTTGSAVVAVMWDFSQVEPDYMAFVNVCNCFYKYINLLTLSIFVSLLLQTI